MTRLLVLAVLGILSYAYLLSISSVQFQNTSCYLHTYDLSGIIKEITYGSSLFLAIGYTAFSGKTVREDVLLTAGAAIGLIWYALLAAVVIRRVYR